MIRQAPEKGNSSVETEIWYGGHELQRRDQQVKDASGRTLSSSTIILNGTRAWIATTEDGTTRVVQTTGTTWNDTAEDPSRQQSLTDVLAEFSPGKGCMDARLTGQGSVAGQATYVILATPKKDGCGDKLANPTVSAKVRAAQNGKPSPEPEQAPTQLSQMLVWVDKSSFLPLKIEVRDPSGKIIDRSEVMSVQYNLVIPDATFSYTAPAGASVFTFTGGTGADVKGALCQRDPSLKCQAPPAKKP